MKIESGFRSLNYATCMMCILEGDEQAQEQLRPYLPGSDVAWARSLRLLSPVPEILSVSNWLRNLLVIQKGFNLSFSFTCSCTRLQRSGEGHQGLNGIGSFSRLFVLQSNSLQQDEIRSCIVRRSTSSKRLNLAAKLFFFCRSEVSLNDWFKQVSQPVPHKLISPSYYSDITSVSLSLSLPPSFSSPLPPPPVLPLFLSLSLTSRTSRTTYQALPRLN